MKRYTLLSILLILILLFSACGGSDETPQAIGSTQPTQAPAADAADVIPEFSTEPYVALNGNIPEFEDELKTTESFESYAPLDHLGRCGTAFACIGKDLMPTEDRGSIGQVKPSGWQTIKYDFVDGKYLYNRCHLIGFQLTGENANEENLITGTRYMNVQGMLPFENMVADYIKETNNHVLYRVTPIFEGNNLVASAVQMEALSVEDDGEGICFNVYVYNNQPGVQINYATGESSEAPVESSSPSTDSGAASAYVLNTNSMKFHFPSCDSVEKISDDNRQDYTGDRQMLLNQGYSPCGNCHP